MNRSNFDKTTLWRNMAGFVFCCAAILYLLFDRDFHGNDYTWVVLFAILAVFALFRIFICLKFEKIRKNASSEAEIVQAECRKDLIASLLTNAEFFLGILLAVSALQSAGHLSLMSNALDGCFKDATGGVFIIDVIIGILSSVVDNVPLVAACIKMFTGMTGADPTYLSYFIEDGLFWHLLTFTAGVGGSLLIIGSAAGVVAMGIEKIPFFWYFKKITFIAFLGYLAGILFIWLENFIL